VPGLPQAARETLAGAAAVAGQVSGSLRGPLMEAASAAFVSGLRATSITAAVIMAVIAVPAAVLLRHVRADGDGPAQQQRRR
jgi:DHA2 family multidrug resistance protein-like MFS transporter